MPNVQFPTPTVNAGGSQPPASARPSGPHRRQPPSPCSQRGRPAPAESAASHLRGPNHLQLLRGVIFPLAPSTLRTDAAAMPLKRLLAIAAAAHTRALPDRLNLIVGNALHRLQQERRMPQSKGHVQRLAELSRPEVASRLFRSDRLLQQVRVEHSVGVQVEGQQALRCGGRP